MSRNRKPSWASVWNKGMTMALESQEVAMIRLARLATGTLSQREMQRMYAEKIEAGLRSVGIATASALHGQAPERTALAVMRTVGAEVSRNRRRLRG